MSYSKQFSREIKRYRRYVDRLEKSAKNPTPLMRRIGMYGVSSTVKRIKAGVEPENAPLTKSYKRSSGTLRDSGGLTQSLSYESGKKFAAWGSNKIQARILHEGGTIKPKKANWLYVPAGMKARRLMRRFGESPGQAIKGLKADGWRVWQQGRTVQTQRTKRSKPVTLFILMAQVEIPSRKYLVLDSEDQAEILDLLERWLKDVPTN